MARGSELIASVVDESDLPHSQRLFPLIEQTLDSLSLSISSIDRFAVNTGPGSFTGLRVGIAALKGVAVTLGKPLLGLNKMDALTYAMKLPGITVAILLNAGRDEYYWGNRRLQDDSSLLTIGVDRLVNAAQIVSEMRSLIGDPAAVFVGNGAAALWPDFVVNPNWQLAESPVPLVNIIAQWAATQSPLEATVEAYYLRQSYAEVKRVK